MKPHCCPVCHGTGKVSRPPWVAGDVATWQGSSACAYACTACSGTGVVWEPRDVLAEPTHRTEWTLTYGRHRGEMKPRYSGPAIDAAVEWRGGGRISATLDSAGNEWTNGGES